MKLFPPPRAAPHHRRSGRRSYPAIIETTADFAICFSLASFVFSSRTFFSAAAGGEKKELEGNGIFGSHNMNTAQHCPNTCSRHPSMDS